MSTRLEGRAAAPGVALAPAFVVTTSPGREASFPDEREGPADEELSRLTEALTAASEQLSRLAARMAEEVGEGEGEIFEAHAEFAADPELASLAEASIEDGASAERAVHEAFGTFRDLLSGSDSQYLAARAEDLDDVRDRVIAILQGVDTAAIHPVEPSVIIADSLTPSQTAEIPRQVIAAIVTATGSPTSHAAILARALGVPAVVAVEGMMEAIEGGSEVAVDGQEGTVLVDPDEDEREALTARMEEEAARRRELEQLRDQPGATGDGHRVELAANIGSPDDLPAAIDAGAEGSGLVRTEFLFLDRTTAPTVEEQTHFYRQVALAFPGHRVVFRTLDVGADKPLPFVERDPEENPALGVRGIRLSLARPQLLTDQLRALLAARASLAEEEAGRMAIMFPLVSLPRELIAARRILEEVAAEEGHDLADLEIGVMVEVPMAALAAERIARHADFLSIGTNDLLQYLFAADRLIGEVADLPDLCEPEVLNLLGQVVEAGHRHHAWVGVCGEAASDPVQAVALVGLGIDELSMTRAAIPEVKDTLQRLTLAECRTGVEAALAAPDATEARAALEAVLES